MECFAGKNSSGFVSRGLIAFILLLIGVGLIWHSYSADATESQQEQELEVVTRSIEDLQLGHRVIGHDPTGKKSLAKRPDITEDWRAILFELKKKTGGLLKVKLLRPKHFLENIQTKGKDKFYFLNLPEFGAVGFAKVTAIKPCPEIESGDGNIVTGTFEHDSGDVIDIHVSGQTEPIGTTDNHPFWSEDRQKYIEAGKLKVGEQLRTLCGFAYVMSIEPRAGPEKSTI